VLLVWVEYVIDADRDEYPMNSVVKVWGNAVPTPPVFSIKRSPPKISKKRRGTLKENAKVRLRADYCNNYDSFTHYR